ncbi:LexA family protein [Clostridium paridis]|uniref:LexA family transcriptional regulator n=1 Tax=Clostridium paridis TaxID=2803863 RepID=A0A937FIU9_9CLOT|nr:LexA family transcriptional regulator [Clostridium paridis]MBL4933998.1 LexA family transcriptional regulator [Clostridium paridis]
MNLNKSQSRFVNSKSLGYQFLKGKKLTGKTTAAIYRVVNIENNYRLFPDEKIIYIISEKNLKDKVQELYQDVKSEIENKYFSLFSYFNKGVEVAALEDIITSFAQGFLRDKMISLKYASFEEEENLIKSIYEDKKSEYKKSKFIQNVDYKFLKDEFTWIKSNGFSKVEYLEARRKGREGRIGKGSKTREAIYDLLSSYNENLAQSGLMDRYDEVNYAHEYSKKTKGIYTHIVLDNCKGLSLKEINFIDSLLTPQEYSSIVYILGEEKMVINPFKNIKSKTFRFNEQFKTFYNEWNPIEHYEFIDINKGVKRKFFKDTSINTHEIVEKNDKSEYTYKENDIKEFPLFSNIAAGEPILMNEEVEEMIYLPKEWIKNSNEVFFLRVKGDSMENANIFHGDIVAINKRSMADHNEIVAIDIEGSATLKRLKLNGEVPVLMPENDKYDPIYLAGKETNILGVAIGIIKKNG